MQLLKTIKYITATFIASLVGSQVATIFRDRKTKIVDKNHPIYITVKTICDVYGYNYNDIVIRREKNLYSPYSYNDYLYGKFNIVLPHWYLTTALLETSPDYKSLLVNTITNKGLHIYFKTENKLISSVFKMQIETNNYYDNLDKQFIYTCARNDLFESIQNKNNETLQRYKFALAHEIAHYSPNILYSIVTKHIWLLLPHCIE
ncbi:MAG: hypothetical protein EOP34_06930, partial [Rickettsiales bacterium]